MNIQEIRELALSLPSVTEDIKWDNHLCFNIGGKMFLVTSPDSFPITASLKVSDEDFEILVKRGIIPAPYLARHKWIQLDNISRFSSKDWKKYVNFSYQLISSKLPSKVKKEIGL